MTARNGKTAIASTVFVDIVGYSRARIAPQTAMKVRLNEIVGKAIGNVPEGDRIIVDTGDGMAICLMGEPEQALFIAMEINAAARQVTGIAKQSLRTGIHLGPIKLMRDLNGRPNVLGDGINFAQRIMSFAEEGQILVSRAYFEVVSRLDEGNERLFSYLGVRHDKHVQEHQVYAVTDSPSPRPARHEDTDEAPGGDREYVMTVAEAAAYPGDGSSAMPPELVEQEKQRLAVLIGPLAELLVARAATAAADAPSFYRSIAAAIPTERDRDRFLAGVPSEIRPDLAPQREDPPARGRAARFEPEQLAAIEKALAGAIGPLAKTLVKREAARARSLADLHDRLATFIDNPANRERFLLQRNKGA